METYVPQPPSPNLQSPVPSPRAEGEGGKGAMLGIELLMNPTSKGAVRHSDDEVTSEQQYNVSKDDSDPRLSDAFASGSRAYEPKPSYDARPKYAPSEPDVDQEVRREVYSDYGRPHPGPEELLEMKRELLYRFDRLESKGVRLPRKFTLNSSYEDMKHEYARLKRDREIDNSIVMQRNILMTIVSSIEFLNNRFDPFDLKLDGWSENVNDSINNYDDIFEELHDKYKGKGNLPPELKLLMLLGGSAFTFHLTNTMFKSHLPEARQVFSDNPELARQFASATAASMSQSAQQRGDRESAGMASMFQGLFGGGAPPQPPSPMAPAAAPRPAMKGPRNLDGIFSMAEQNAQQQQDAASVSSRASSLIEIMSDGGGDISDASSNGTRMPDSASILVSALPQTARGRGGRRGSRAPRGGRGSITL